MAGESAVHLEGRDTGRGGSQLTIRSMLAKTREQPVPLYCHVADDVRLRE